MSHSREAYKQSGVNVEEGYKAVEMMKHFVNRTHNDKVIGGLGNFSGMMRLGQYKDPVLCSGTDGVGTKLKVAFLMDRHDTVGIDLVAMCVNDILCQGAEPLFFLDYIATGRLEAEKAAMLVKGVSEGCLESGMALLGGETAEMPGFYPEGEYDMAGFAVGVVEKEDLIDGLKISVGDVVIGLPSTGFHSNGYSLVRKTLIESGSDSSTGDAKGVQGAKSESEEADRLNSFVPELGETLGEALLRSTKIYVKEVAALKTKVELLGMCHITGGGFYENVPRMLKNGMGVTFDDSKWEVPAVVKYLQDKAGLSKEEMYGTFNMGIGFMIVVKPEQAALALSTLHEQGFKGQVIGAINGDGQVTV